MTRITPSTHSDLTLVSSAECMGGFDCGHGGAGHYLSFMQRRLAQSTPSKWRDAIVSEVHPDGRIHVVSVDDSAEVVLWNHSHGDLADRIGEPVAVHSVYGVLALGENWLNVAVVSSVVSAN
jgi:hypothetical protein